MAKVSVILPARNERYLNQTLDEVFGKAQGEVEAIVVLDGPTAYEQPFERRNMQVLRKDRRQGMRAAINDAAQMATGRYLMKLDSHCALSQGYDVILSSYCADDWVVIPRRYDLTPDWQLKPKSWVDYYYISCPWTNPVHFVIQSCPWVRKSIENTHKSMDETLSFQGACWFTSTKFFQQKLGPLEETGYGTFAGEPQEIGFKAWLSGGAVLVNKNAWYAHMRGGARGYDLNDLKMWDGLIWAAHYWTEDRWPHQVHPFEWLIDKFWPLPLPETLIHGEKYSWPANWKEYHENARTTG